MKLNLLKSPIVIIIVAMFVTACSASNAIDFGNDSGVLAGAETAALPYGADCVVNTDSSARTAEYKRLGGLDAICASYAYDRGWTGEGQTVAVLDSPFATTHAEFGTTLADKFNGFYDASEDLDTHASIRCNVAACTATHGTHVAGIIAANNDDSNMHGVAYDAKIKAVTIFSNTTIWDLSTSELRNAIDEGSGSNIVAMNNSWGSSDKSCYFHNDVAHFYNRPPGKDFDKANCLGDTIDHTPAAAERRAWRDAVGDGTIVVFANGNHGLNSLTGKVQLYTAFDFTNSDTPDATVSATDIFGKDKANIPSFRGTFPRYDAELEGKWITVIAVDQNNNNEIASFSNGCGSAKNYCIAAPGVAIYGPARHYSASLWVTGKGTSQAAPHVSGALAVLKQAFPSMDSEQLVSLVLDTASDLGREGTDEVYGRGMLNLDNASRPQGDTNAVITNNQTFGGGVLIEDTSLALANHFGGGVQNVQLGMRDDYERTFITSVAQVTYQPVTIGLDTYMSDFTKPKGQTTELSPQVNMVISNEANKNWMNGQYQSGKSITSIAFHDSYQPNPFADNSTITPDSLRASHIRPASEDIAQMNATHRLNTNLVLTSYAGHGRYDTGHDFTELGNDIFYNKDSYFMNLGIGHLREYEQFLGADGTGAYAMQKPALSRFTDISMGKALNDKFSIYGNYTHYQTDVTMRYEEFARIEGLEANQYQIGLKGKNILQNDDALKIVLATKLGVTDGDMVQNTVIGYKNKDYNNVTQYYDLSTQERHQQLSLSYQGKLAQNNENKQSLFSNNRFFTTLNIDRNMHHQTGLSHTEIISGVTAEF